MNEATPVDSKVYCIARVPKLLAVTPKTIIFEVGTPLYLYDSIPQINIVKIADLKAHSAAHRKAL